MATTTPTIVQVNNIAAESLVGTSARRMVEIYVEATPATDADTTDLATHVPNLSAISGMQFNGTATSEYADASNVTWSGTTVTWTTAGAQFLKVTGYYT